MAGGGHVDVSERRLRPIYDCLDNGNNKEALKEADKCLKKQKDFQCAKVLKALALLRLGRQDESDAILRAVHAQSPTDEATLQAMVICYKELHENDLIADLYENAHKAKPDNEEILSALFMAYVRLGNYKKQQQTAMALHRLEPTKNPYYFWAVMSCVMQAYASDPKLGKTMFLPLAERMVQKYVNEDKIKAEAEVQMYLIILEQLEKHEEALKMVEGPLGEKLTMELNCREAKTASFCMKLERWPQANAIYRKLLLDNPDHWLYYQEYLKSLLALIDQKWEPGNESDIEVDYSVPQAAKFISERVDQCLGEGKRPQRGPYLAQLELIKLLKERKSEEVDTVGSPYTFLKQYFTMFGTKYCCFSDLKPYIGLLDETEHQKWIDDISSTLNMGTTEASSEELVFAKDPQQLQQHITVVQLSRSLGLQDNLTVLEKNTLSKELVLRYQKGLPFGANLLTTDLQYSDNYLLLAVHLLIDVWRETKNNGILWQMILLLEGGLEKSPSSFQIKLLLIKLYCSVGAFGRCPSLYDSMDIKHVQNDTLGYTVSNQVTRVGHFASACAVFGSMLRFFTVNYKDTTEYLISAYKFGSFTKVQEFVKFRDRLQNSVQFSTASAERLLLDLILETNNHASTEQIVNYIDVDPAKDKTVWDDLRDNRDLDAMVNWAPDSRCLSEELKKKSFLEEKAWLKHRSLTVRALTASVMLSQNKPATVNDHKTTNNVKPMEGVLQQLCEEMKTHTEYCRKEFSTPVDYSLWGPWPTKLIPCVSSNLDRVLLTMFETVLYIFSLHEEGVERLVPAVEEGWKKNVIEILKTVVAQNTNPVITMRDTCKECHVDTVEQLVLLAETISYLCVILGVCHKLLKPWKTSLTKRKKKKKDEAPVVLPPTFENFKTLLSGLEKVAQDLKLAVDDISTLVTELDLQDLSLVEKDVLGQDYADKDILVWKHVEDSYRQTAKEVGHLLHHKILYLGSLRL